MTKRRPPLSFEDGITRVAAHMGWPAAAAAIGAEERTLRAYSDPDDDRHIKLRDALVLDTAHHAAGGEGAPMYEAYALQLEICHRAAGSSFEQLARQAAKAAKEGGEAIAALIACSRAGATDAERALALREVRENIDVLLATLPMLEAGSHPPGPPASIDSG